MHGILLNAFFPSLKSTSEHFAHVGTAHTRNIHTLSTSGRLETSKGKEKVGTSAESG